MGPRSCPQANPVRARKRTVRNCADRFWTEYLACELRINGYLLRKLAISTGCPKLISLDVQDWFFLGRFWDSVLDAVLALSPMPRPPRPSGPSHQPATGKPRPHLLLPASSRTLPSHAPPSARLRQALFLLAARSRRSLCLFTSLFVDCFLHIAPCQAWRERQFHQSLR